MMANFDIVYIVARKICIIRVKSAGHGTAPADLLQRRPGTVRCPTVYELW